MLEQHPNLIFVGMHMASLEWSVDELAKFLDRFPRASVDLAARIGQLQYQVIQNRDKVERFLIKYQDRLTYGTDLDQEINDPKFAETTRQVWLRDWQFFTSSDTLTVPELDQPVQALALPKDVIDKIYSKNARRLYPSAWH
jgi:predicted TIM-barrel fold metal-dependent hydrolase